MSQIKLTKIKDMIDDAFRDEEQNKVNFELITSVIYLLARKLNLLNRRFFVEYENFIDTQEPQIRVTEIEIKANVPKTSKQMHVSEITKPSSPLSEHNVSEATMESSSLLSAPVLPWWLSKKTACKCKNLEECFKIPCCNAGTTAKPVSKQPLEGTDIKKYQNAIKTSGSDLTMIKENTATAKPISKQPPKGSDTKIYHDVIKTPGSDSTMTKEITGTFSSSATAKHVSKQSSNSKKLKDVTKSGSDSTTVRRENILIYGRIKDNSTPTTSLVTREQFEALQKCVDKIRKQYEKQASSKDLEFRNKAEFTDPMVVIQLGVRIELIEQATHRMITLLTEILNLYKAAAAATTEITLDPDIYVTHGKLKSSMNELSVAISDEARDVLTKLYNSIFKASRHVDRTKISVAEGVGLRFDDTRTNESELDLKNTPNIPELKATMSELEDSVSGLHSRYRCIRYFYALKMKAYQARIISMTVEIERITEAVNDFLSDPGDELNAAINELNEDYNTFERYLSSVVSKLNDFEKKEMQLEGAIKLLRKYILEIEESTITREEFEERLKFNVGIKEINQLVLIKPNYVTLRSYLEKKICTATDTFSNQEYFWQKLIEESLKCINRKSEKHILIKLCEDIDLKIAKLKESMNLISPLTKIPTYSYISPQKRHKIIEGPCLSCGDPKWDQSLPGPGGDHIAVGLKLSKQSPKQEKSSKFSVSSDQKCYPGSQICHRRNCRLSACSRICGGTDSQLTSKLPTLIVQKLRPDRKPKRNREYLCLPCIKPEPKISQYDFRGIHQNSAMTLPEK